MSKTSPIIIFCFLFFLSIPITANAFAVKTGDSIYIAEDETIKGNLYAAGMSVTVDGEVTGDIICAAQTVNINGRVAGDVICGGQVININGVIGGSARAISANALNINGQVERNVMAFSSSINLGHEARVGWDMLLGGADSAIRGKIGRGLHGGGANIIIAGEVGGDVRLRTSGRQSEKSGLTIANTAVINGDIAYTDRTEASIGDGAQITGEITRQTPPAKDTSGRRFVSWAWGRLLAIFSALVVGLVLVSIWPGQIKKITDKMIKRGAAATLWGAVIMFLTPIIIILLLVTVIGIPLAAILAGAWLIALYISKILAGIVIGRLLLKKNEEQKDKKEKKKNPLMLPMIIGITIGWILFSTPVVGWILSLVAIWWGLGGIWLKFRSFNSKK